MSNAAYVALTSVFAVGDLRASITFEGGARETVVLTDGKWHAENLPSKPVNLKLVDAADLENASSGFEQGAPSGTPVDIGELWTDGVAIPDDGRLEIELVWSDNRPPDKPTGDGVRFSGWEHKEASKLIGQNEAGGVLVVDGKAAPFDRDTHLAVGGNQLTFGWIVALAGDYYAHIDDAAATAFEFAWPQLEKLGWLVDGDYRRLTLAYDSEDAVRHLCERIATKVQGAAAIRMAYHDVRDFPLRRYLALAGHNYCHFRSPRPGAGPEDSLALRTYRAYHHRATVEAAAAGRNRNEAGLLAALAVDAFGCHFLTDLFASGHMRVPRQFLMDEQGFVHGSWSSKSMHDEDNKFGLWCTRRENSGHKDRDVWMSFGDDDLLSHPAHLREVQRAVQRSTADVFTAYVRREVPRNNSAEALIPIPLPPGHGPVMSTDHVFDKREVKGPSTNHFPLYWWDTHGTLLKRTSDAYATDCTYEPVGNAKATVPAFGWRLA